jgi:flagella basal body P-ring formation protein FlgA
MKRTLLTLLAFSFSFGANAQNFLESASMNDPVYSEDLAENMAINELASEASSSSANVPSSVPQESLVSTDIVIPRFFLKDSQPALTEKLSDQLETSNIGLDKLKFKREGSSKTFTYDQIKNVVIKTKFSIETMDVDNTENTFAAVLKPQNGKYKIEVTGIYDINRKVPVLSRNISKGGKISQDDIELKSVANSSIIETDITDVSDIIGKTAVKSLTKGKMIAEEDISDAIVITKNSSVSAVFKTETIEIKALAVALEDGSEGDIIKLKNFDSGKVFKAVVQADGSVMAGSSSSALTASIPDDNELNNFN